MKQGRRYEFFRIIAPWHNRMPATSQKTPTEQKRRNPCNRDHRPGPSNPSRSNGYLGSGPWVPAPCRQNASVRMSMASSRASTDRSDASQAGPDRRFSGILSKYAASASQIRRSVRMTAFTALRRAPLVTVGSGAGSAADLTQPAIKRESSPFIVRSASLQYALNADARSEGTDTFTCVYSVMAHLISRFADRNKRKERVSMRNRFCSGIP